MAEAPIISIDRRASAKKRLSLQWPVRFAPAAAKAAPSPAISGGAGSGAQRKSRHASIGSLKELIGKAKHSSSDAQSQPRTPTVRTVEHLADSKRSSLIKIVESLDHLDRSSALQIDEQGASQTAAPVGERAQSNTSTAANSVRTVSLLDKSHASLLDVKDITQDLCARMERLCSANARLRTDNTALAKLAAEHKDESAALAQQLQAALQEKELLGRQVDDERHKQVALEELLSSERMTAAVREKMLTAETDRQAELVDSVVGQLRCVKLLHRKEITELQKAVVSLRRQNMRLVKRSNASPLLTRSLSFGGGAGAAGGNLPASAALPGIERRIVLSLHFVDNDAELARHAQEWFARDEVATHLEFSLHVPVVLLVRQAPASSDVVMDVFVAGKRSASQTEYMATNCTDFNSTVCYGDFDSERADAIGSFKASHAGGLIVGMHPVDLGDSVGPRLARSNSVVSTIADQHVADVVLAVDSATYKLDELANDAALQKLIGMLRLAL